MCSHLNKLLLHVEGLVFFIVSTYVYFYLGFSGLLFAILLLAPDISAIGYVWNNKIGAILYNLFHTYTTPIVLLLVGYFLHYQIFTMVSLIWIAHIGMDRTVGYGLKYMTNFKDNHLNRV